MLPLTAAQIESYKQQLRDNESPERRGLDGDTLRSIWKQGNKRRPRRRNDSDNFKINKLRTQRRWKRFCAVMGEEDWKATLKKISFEERGLTDSFFDYLMDDELGRGIGAENTIRVYQRNLKSLYKKYTGREVEEALSEHFLALTEAEITPKHQLRRKPKLKPNMGPEFFMQHIHFIWVRSQRIVHIGLDDIDDALIRHLCMWTGCREHELVYNKPQNLEKLLKEYDDESDAYTDVEPDPLMFRPSPRRKCWVCGGDNERDHNSELKLLCWEDINFSIIRNPSGNGGRDLLVMTVLLHWHKGENKRVVPTWFPLIEEDIPALCPVTHILAKAIAEGVIEHNGYQTSPEPFFNTKLNDRDVFIQWKKEWMHKPVFRRTINALGEKSDSPQTTHVFNNRSNNLGKEMGLKEKLSQYCYRRGAVQTVDGKHASIPLCSLYQKNKNKILTII